MPEMLGAKVIKFKRLRARFMRLVTRLAGITTCLSLLLSGLVASAASNAELEVAVDRVVAAEMQKQNIVGLAIGLIDDGQIRMYRYYGFEDLDQKIPTSDQTMFRWASISKPVTAVAAMQLVEAGKLDLAKDVRDYVPEFPEKEYAIKVRDLLCHQGGVPHYMPNKVFPTKREYDMENPFEDLIIALDKFNLSPLLFEPGTQYSYTTYGYMLLGAVVQRAAEQKYADLTREKIFVPLGMSSMQPDYQWIDIPHRTIGYRRMPERHVLPSKNEDVSWKLAGGGFISNIGDLTRFANGLLHRQLLSSATYDQMWAKQKTADGKETEYCLGFGIADIDGTVQIGHSGSQEKTRTNMAIRPATGRGVAVMCNTEGVSLTNLTNNLFNVLDGKPIQEETQAAE